MHRILITGVAGFIGFNFAKHILENGKCNVTGIDNFNNYYDVNLKKNRNKQLKKFKNYKFFKIDILNQKKIDNLFKSKKFNYVFHFAAQAGVRFSINNPRKYIDCNYLGFYNIIELCNKYSVKRFFYASSSSVYGDNKKFPLSEKLNIQPKNIYGLSKKSNEEISSIFNIFYGLKSTGLRFFTVYGEWGRPDMMMMKFISAYYNKKKFLLYNYGKHVRDFTYIGDVVKILSLLLKSNNKLGNADVFNICSNKPISLDKIIKIMNKNNIKPKIKKISLQRADIIKTHGNNKKLLKVINFKRFSQVEQSIYKTIHWFRNYRNNF